MKTSDYLSFKIKGLYRVRQQLKTENKTKKAANNRCLYKIVDHFILPHQTYPGSSLYSMQLQSPLQIFP